MKHARENYNVIEAIGRGVTRDEMAQIYLDYLLVPPKRWRDINVPIVNYWSKAGLIYIKRKAQKLRSDLRVRHAERGE